MLDGFSEQLIRHRNTAKDRLFACGIVLGSIIGAVAILFLGKLLRLNIIAIFAAGALVVFAIRTAALHKWEFEYIGTAGEIDIDKIMAQRSRKRMVSFRAADCEIIAPYTRGNYMAPYKNLMAEDYSAFLEHPENYFAVFEKAGVRRLVVFQPNEQLLRMCKQHNPRQVFID